MANPYHINYEETEPQEDIVCSCCGVDMGYAFCFIPTEVKKNILCLPCTSEFVLIKQIAVKEPNYSRWFWKNKKLRVPEDEKRMKIHWWFVDHFLTKIR